MKNLVSELRMRSEGRPIGIKIAAGRIEKDLEFCVYAEPDFITIDGRGGATGASPAIIRATLRFMRSIERENIWMLLDRI